MAITHAAMWPLLAGTLGAATLAAAGTPGVKAPDPAYRELQPEIVVRARMADALLAKKVSDALQQDPYVFAEHVSVSAENGVLRVTGIVRDLSDLFAILKAARRVAGARRVVDEIEYIPVDDDGN